MEGAVYIRVYVHRMGLALFRLLGSNDMMHIRCISNVGIYSTMRHVMRLAVRKQEVM